MSLHVLVACAPSLCSPPAASRRSPWSRLRRRAASHPSRRSCSCTARSPTRRASTGSSTGCAVTATPSAPHRTRWSDLQFDAETVRAFPRQHPGPQDPGRSLLRRRRDHAGRQRRPRRQGTRLPRRARPDSRRGPQRAAHEARRAPDPAAAARLGQGDRNPTGRSEPTSTWTRRSSAPGSPPTCRRGVAADLAATQRPLSAAAFTSTLTVEPPGRPSRAGTSCPSGTWRWRPTSSGSRQTACTRTRARSTPARHLHQPPQGSRRSRRAGRASDPLSSAIGVLKSTQP